MDCPDPWVVVGLGNPGPAYEATRHNIGFRFADALIQLWKAVPEECSGPMQLYRAKVDETIVYVVKPMTYMNRSGEALKGFGPSEDAGPGRHLIVYDDIDLPFGALRFRKRGGSGGHNGLASVLDALGTQEVPRLRMGIGEEERAGNLADYVLAPFSDEEAEAVPGWVDRAVRGIQVFIEDGPEASMNQFNQ